MTSLTHDTQWIDAIGQAELVSSGKITPLELLDAAIERAEQLNPAINALTFTWFEQARDMRAICTPMLQCHCAECHSSSKTCMLQ